MESPPQKPSRDWLGKRVLPSTEKTEATGSMESDVVRGPLKKRQLLASLRVFSKHLKRLIRGPGNTSVVYVAMGLFYFVGRKQALESENHHTNSYAILAESPGLSESQFFISTMGVGIPTSQGCCKK